MSTWRTDSRSLVSRGSKTRPDGLAGLADARDIHNGQFWTPLSLVKSIWDSALPYFESIRAQGRKAVLMDSGFGAGALWNFARPSQHILMGTETDKRVCECVMADADMAGFTSILKHGSMADVRFAGADLALINPPFSLTFSSETLPRYETNSYGIYGAGTQARSHLFAISQALEAAPVVVAIVPGGLVGEALSIPSWQGRLWGAFTLPANAFADENVQYSTAILVFLPSHHGEVLQGAWDASQPPRIPFPEALRSKVEPEVIEVIKRRPITTPITGDRRVTIAHNGRKLVLRFKCGQVEARALRTIYGERITPTKKNNYRASLDVDRMRKPRGYYYIGDGRFDLEHYIAHPDPVGAFKALHQLLSSLGAEPRFAKGFSKRIEKLIEERRRESIEFSRTIYEDERRASFSDSMDREAFEGECFKNFLCDPKSWGSPVVKPGTTVTFAPAENDHGTFTFAGKTFTVPLAKIREHFKLPNTANETDGRWRTIFKGKQAHLTGIAHNEASRARALGIDKWLWDFQFEDLVELRTVKGAIVGYEMGLGKSRMALSLCLLGGKHNLIVVEAHLIDEMLEEIEKIGLSRDLFQVIRKPGDLTKLRKINLISYSRLRMPLVAGTKRTYAERLRRKVATVVADEAHCLRHRDTRQARALQMLCAKRRYAMTGTAIANYPRDLLPLAVWACGEATASQCYGFHRPHVTPGLIDSARSSVRGVDKFRKDFVTTEWCTNEFSDELNSGAKREIPRIANLAAYREFASRFIKRRVRTEPAVAKYIKLPPQKKIVHTIDWDPGHFDFYRRISDEFANWYRTAHRDDDKQMNLIAILRRIEAVVFAANQPSKHQDGFGSYLPTTSKERAIIEKVLEFTRDGHQTLIFARTPAILNRMANVCRREGVDCGVLHGQIPQNQRTATLKAFRKGEIPVLFGSFGVTQTGLNLHQANRVIFVQRDWTAKTENQAMGRVLRPQQTKEVEFHFFHLRGSIDEYQAQMVAHKDDAAKAGLDFAEPEMANEEFLHIDTILGRFVKDWEEQLAVA